MKILNVGCGENLLKVEGAEVHNLDGPWNPKADLHIDLEHCARLLRRPVNDNLYDEIRMTHTIEHIHGILPMMEWLHRLAKPQARMIVTCPHGASDDADEDPTHVRRMFPTSFSAFAQPYYHKADYGYRGDWQCERVALLFQQDPSLDPQRTVYGVVRERNTVLEMYAELRAIKPIRDRKATQVIAPIHFLEQPEGYRGEPLPPIPEPPAPGRTN